MSYLSVSSKSALEREPSLGPLNASKRLSRSRVEALAVMVPLLGAGTEWDIRVAGGEVCARAWKGPLRAKVANSATLQVSKLGSSRRFTFIG